jgi:hypothetical protein
MAYSSDFIEKWFLTHTHTHTHKHIYTYIHFTDKIFVNRQVNIEQVSINIHARDKTLH